MDKVLKLFPPDPRTGLWTQNRWLSLIIIWFDRFLALKFWKAKNKTGGKDFVIHIGGHIGDAVNDLYLIRAIQEAYPHCNIDVVAPRWTGGLLKLYPGIRGIFWLDSWSYSRVGGRGKRLWTHLRDRLRVIRELRARRYGYAIDFYYFWPNASYLFAQSGVIERLGYTSGGGGRLFTQSLPWVNERKHFVDYGQAILDLLPLRPKARMGCLWAQGSWGELWGSLKSKFEFLEERKYIVFHPGTGARAKEWPEEKWVELLALIEARGHQVVLTGQGEREGVICERLATSSAQAVNLSNKLSFGEFMCVLSRARHIVGVDSLSGHVAAAVGVRSTSIYTGINPLEHWSPYGLDNKVLMHPVVCYPCFIGRGCDTMECIRLVTAEVVAAAIFKQST